MRRCKKGSCDQDVTSGKTSKSPGHGWSLRDESRSPTERLHIRRDRFYSDVGGARIRRGDHSIPGQPCAVRQPERQLRRAGSRCVAVVGELPGTVTITGGNEGRWGCLLSSEVRWLNLSTGASGSARLSDGLNGVPAEAIVQTGTGQVAVAVLSVAGSIITPGVTSFYVP